MLIAQITDAHVGAPGSLFYDRFDTAMALANAVAALNALTPRPDVVLFTGDLTDTGTPQEYAQVRRVLASLSIPLYAVPGNHDRRETMRAAFSDHEYLDPKTPFFNYAIEHHPVRLIGLDTVDPDQFGAGTLCESRLEWLERTLAARSDQPTIIFMHHPTFDTGIEHMDRIKCANGDAFEKIISRHNQIERVLCGHVHRPVLTKLAHAIAMIAPSIAHQVPLDLNPDGPSSFNFEPPAFLLHRWQANQAIVSHTHYVEEFGPAFSFASGQPVN